MSIEPIIVNGGRLLGGGCYCTQCGNYEKIRTSPSHFYGKNFRESNVFPIEETLEKKLFSRNVFSVRVNFSFFHTVHCNCVEGYICPMKMVWMVVRI